MHEPTSHIPLDTLTANGFIELSGKGYTKVGIENIIRSIELKYPDLRWHSKINMINYMNKVLSGADHRNTEYFNSDECTKYLQDEDCDINHPMFIASYPIKQTHKPVKVESSPLWEKARKILAEYHGESTDQAWFSKCNAEAGEGGIVVSATSPFVRDRVKQDFGVPIEEALHRLSEQGECPPFPKYSIRWEC